MQLAESEGRLSEWEAYYDRLQPRQVKTLIAYRRLHPWPEEREDWRWAMMTHVLMKAWVQNPPEPDKILELLKPKRKTKAEKRGWISPNAAAAMVSRIAGG